MCEISGGELFKGALFALRRDCSLNNITVFVICNFTKNYLGLVEAISISDLLISTVVEKVSLIMIRTNSEVELITPQLYEAF